MGHSSINYIDLTSQEVVRSIASYYVKFFYPLGEVKASQVNKLQAKYGPACHFSSARAFTFAQRVKKLNIVGIVAAEK
jgi:hypothetical protein